jgi:hypothetical protein
MRAEGADGNFYFIMSIPGILISFPFFWLCSVVQILQHPIYFAISILVDIMLYALIIERINKYYRSHSFKRLISDK